MYRPTNKRTYTQIIADGELDPRDFRTALAEVARRLQYEVNVYPQGILPLVGQIIETVLLDTEKGIERFEEGRVRTDTAPKGDSAGSPEGPVNRSGRGSKKNSRRGGSTGGSEGVSAGSGADSPSA